MGNKSEVIALLQNKQLLEHQLESLSYGSIEIRERGSNKYIYVHYREDGVSLTKYIDEYSDDLYNLILNNNVKAKKLKKQIRDINKELKKLNYIENEVNSDVEINIDFAKRHLAHTIYKQAILEGIHEVTFQGEDDGLGVNFKKHGEFSNKGSIPTVLVSSFVAKLKSLSELDPSVSEVPQLGKLCFKVDNIIVIASVSTFPTIMGERIFLKIYKPPKKLEEIISSKTGLAEVKQALNKPGIILVCGSALSGKTHVIYSLLLEAAKNKSKNIMTLESISKYELTGVNQCEFNENVGFNMDKAARFIEFQAPDIIYLEGIKSKESFDYFSSLVYNDKTVVMEFLANNMDDLRNKMSFSDFDTLKSIISCMIFIHSQTSVEVFNRETIQKYLG